MVVDGETGFLREAGDVEALAAAALTLLEDEALHARFAQAARTRAVQSFSEDQVTPLYTVAYEDALRGATVASGR